MGIWARGILTINGGEIYAKGAAGCAAIGARYEKQSSDTDTVAKIVISGDYSDINGGKVSVSDWFDETSSGNSYTRSWTSFISKDDENKLATDRSNALNEVTIKINGEVDTPNPPSTGGSSYAPPTPSVSGGTGWTAVNKSISTATEGSDVAINMNGATELPKSVLDAVKGKDINLVITMSNGYVWTINGKDITETKNIDLTVKKPLTQRIPTEVLNTVTGEKYQLYLGFSGDFGFKAVLTLPLGSSNSGRYANLFYFNPTTQKLEYISSGKIGSDGKADLDFSHASDYVITITSEIVTETIDTAESSAVDDNSQSNPTTGDRAIPFGAIIVIATGVILIKIKKQSDLNL